MHSIVKKAPFFNDDLSLQDAQKIFLVQAFISQSIVKTLHMTIFEWAIFLGSGHSLKIKNIRFFLNNKITKDCNQSVFQNVDKENLATMLRNISTFKHQTK